MNDYPVIRLTILFAVGILIQHLFNIDDQIVYYFLASLLAFSLLLLAKIHLHIPLTKQIIVSVLIILFGVSIAALNKNTTKELPTNIIHKANTVIYGSIKEVNLLQKDKVKFVVTTDSILTTHAKFIGSLNLQCTFKEKKDKLLKFYNSIYPGNKIKITRSIYEARDKRNPGEFDYKKYLKSSNCK